MVLVMMMMMMMMMMMAQGFLELSIAKRAAAVVSLTHAFSGPNITRRNSHSMPPIFYPQAK